MAGSDGGTPQSSEDTLDREVESMSIEEMIDECRRRGILLESSDLDHLSEALKKRLRSLLKSSS